MNTQRTIYVKSTATQKKYKIDTNAQTLGELKQVLSNNGIDYTNMDFTEGITKTTLTNDSDLLPTNVEYKGATTNNLVFLLTNTSKNISSGMTRKEIYQVIKDNNYQEDIKEEFGRNYTLVSNEDLENYIAEEQLSIQPTAPERTEPLNGTVVEEVDEREQMVNEMEENKKNNEETPVTKEELSRAIEIIRKELNQALTKSLKNALELFED